jgi:hypothetical protein
MGGRGTMYTHVSKCKNDKRRKKFSELIGKKGKLLEKVNLAQKELEGLESSLKEAGSEMVSTEVEFEGNLWRPEEIQISTEG